MAAEIPVPSDAEVNLIPVLNNLRVDDPPVEALPEVQDMAIDQENDVDVMIRLEQEDMQRERDAMEQLVNRIVEEEPQDDIEIEHNVFRFTYVILSDYDIGTDRFDHQNLQIRWVVVKRNTIAAAVQIMINMLEDPLPKGLIVACFSRFFEELGLPLNDVMQGIRTIKTKMQTVFTHNLCFSTSIFKPSLEKTWSKTAQYNMFVRSINIEMERTPLSIHKSLLRKVKSLGRLACKGEMWTEFRNNSGVGSTLAKEGVAKVCSWYGNHCLRGMVRVVDHDTPLVVSENEPAVLSLTPGYKGDVMVKFLKQMGTYKAPPRYPPNTKRYKRQQKQLNRDLKGDFLRPHLSSIGRRVSTYSTSSSSTASSRNSRGSSGGSRRGEGDLADEVKIVRLERDNLDLQNVIQSLKDKNEDVMKERRRGEENLTSTITRLFSEMEWMSRDRTELSAKLIKAEQALQTMKEDRDQLSDDLRKKRKE